MNAEIPASIRSLLETYPVITPVTVQWGEMDAAGIVNNAVYIRWLEVGRTGLFQAIGFMDLLDTEGAGAILGHIECKYLFPVTWPDTVYIGSRPAEIRADRFTVEAAIASERHMRLVALSKATVVAYDYQQKSKTELPAGVLKRIQGLLG